MPKQQEPQVGLAVLGKVNKKEFSVRYWRREYKRKIARVESTWQVYEGKAPKYPCHKHRNANAVHGSKEDKCRRDYASEQSNVPFAHCL